MNVMGELQTIIQTSGFSRAKLALLLKEMTPKEVVPRIKKPQAGTVTEFTEVKRVYTCLHCDAVHISIVKLREHEDTAVLTKSGSVQIINSSSPAEVHCICSTCPDCIKLVKSLSREELEARYIWLLQHSSLIGKDIPYGKKITTGNVQVKL